MCVCVCVLDLVCVCFCHALYENFVCSVCLHTTDLYNHGYLHIVCFSLSCKALSVSESTINSLVIVVEFHCVCFRFFFMPFSET